LARKICDSDSPAFAFAAASLCEEACSLSGRHLSIRVGLALGPADGGQWAADDGLCEGSIDVNANANLSVWIGGNTRKCNLSRPWPTIPRGNARGAKRISDQRPATSDQRPATSDQRPAISDQRPAAGASPTVRLRQRGSGGRERGSEDICLASRMDWLGDERLASGLGRQG
jgi:hypothetical protein